jgi:hypothetical protein
MANTASAIRSPNRRGPGIGWLEDATVQISQLLARSAKDGHPAGWPKPALVALVPDQHARSFGASRS